MCLDEVISCFYFGFGLLVRAERGIRWRTDAAPSTPTRDAPARQWLQVRSGRTRSTHHEPSRKRRPAPRARPPKDAAHGASPQRRGPRLGLRLPTTGPPEVRPCAEGVVGARVTRTALGPLAPTRTGSRGSGVPSGVLDTQRSSAGSTPDSGGRS